MQSAAIQRELQLCLQPPHHTFLENTSTIPGTTMDSLFSSPSARDPQSVEVRARSFAIIAPVCSSLTLSGRFSQATPKFSALPDELFVHNIFLYLSSCEVLRLGSTNKRFKYLCQDDAYWRRKLQEDFNFPVNSTTWNARWLFLYKKFRSPLIYVWGCDPFLREYACPRALIILHYPDTMKRGVSGIPTWTARASSQAPPSCAFRAFMLFC